MKQILFLFTAILLISSCKKAEVNCEDTNYTYDTDVKTIIDNNCNVAGCHNGSGSIGDYGSYAGIKTVLDNGEFEDHVFITGDMPRARLLTFTNKSILQCWMEDE